MTTIFVTGADGFAGRNLFRHLKQRGYEVVGGVRNRARKLSFERQFGRGLVCDVSDAISVARAIASVRADVIVHLAGTSRPNDATNEPLTAYQAIVSGWANVLDAVRRTMPRARVLLASACDVYGTAAGDGPAHETTPLRPVNTFGSFKAAAESIARTYFQNYHLDITTVRPYHVLGAGLPESFFFGSVAQRVVDWEPKDGDRLALPDLDYQRDLLHIDDVVEAYEKLIADGTPHETYNLCSGRAWPVREVVQMIARAAGRTLTLTSLPAEGAVTIPVLWGSPEKLSHKTGWKPTRSLEQAIADLVMGAKSERPAQSARV